MDLLIDRFRRALLPLDVTEPRQVRGDFDLNPEHRAEFPPPAVLTPAAVLVPVIPRPEGVTVLLTERADTLARHAGQVAFPGGRIDPHDASALDAALREAEEEIGLAREAVMPLGTLDPHETGTGYHVTPFVGWVTPPFDLTPDPGEVAAIFEVPLDFLLDRTNHTTGVGTYKERQWRYTAIPYLEHKIWGATAAMIVNLCDRMDGVMGRAR